MRSLSLAAVAMAFATLSSCSKVGLADQPTLSKTALSFDQKGAAFAECGIVSQVEQGRASAGSTSGGGCSSCH